ncbi:hypothetical protein GCM10007424_11430 [Flavobacterium suaedae]|uniref:Nitrogen fixation protein FixH n=1 Tax=Flavobacterium suaedae TaxID=1767027 RepID=A0ABQ1JP45_9FLAO|nr:hypothetical protein [Flavobacterium suaedae]GGB73246.1 hypothetical protein GCM10007424_11430 [Flavobacterium suaedae]
MKKVLKVIGVIIIAVIGINILIAVFSSTETQISKEPEPEKELVYKDVFTFKGNGMKKSESFYLTGADAKVLYKYNAGNSYGGAFSFYVVEKGHDVMTEGGIPEVLTQSLQEESQSTIQKPEGDYYLYVNAVGNWEIIVQEKQ